MFLLTRFGLLQKEVSHLRSLLNGGAVNQDNAMTSSLLGSPGAFNWEGLNGTFSPLTSNKRLSQVCSFVAWACHAQFNFKFPSQVHLCFSEERN